MSFRNLLFPVLGLALPTGAQEQLSRYEEVTDFASLEELAQSLAQQPYQPEEVRLDRFFEDLKFAQHREIRPLPEQALFSADGSDRTTHRIEMLHPGWRFRRPVQLHLMGEAGSTHVPFDRNRFDYGSLELPESVVDPGGYAGFRVLAPNLHGLEDFEFLQFLGASFFRAGTTLSGYGLTARAAAVNVLGNRPEEYPDLSHFWFPEPQAGERTFRCLALLNGPSLTGAYHFTTVPGRATRVRVKASLYLRKPVASLGIAPFTTMFWYGENTHPRPDDYRPEVHNSDGLRIKTQEGTPIWRPLHSGDKRRISVFPIEALRGFGLTQRDRLFSHYQDLETPYHQRTAIWMEPLSGFDQGSITLIEHSTAEETWDNVVTYWSPNTIPTSPDEPLSLTYDLIWTRAYDVRHIAHVVSTRTGSTTDGENPVFVVDFDAGNEQLEEGELPELLTSVTGHDDAALVAPEVLRNPETGGWRVRFAVDVPRRAKALELSAELQFEGEPISERWVYPWEPR